MSTLLIQNRRGKVIEGVACQLGRKTDCNHGMSSHSYSRSSFFLSQTPVPLTACRSIPLSKKTTFQTFLRLSSSANNWFLPCHFRGSALPRGQVPTSLASLPWPTVPWPPPFSLHTAYMLPDWFSLCLQCPRLVPPSGLARMLSRIDPLALSPHTLSVLLGLTQLSKLWEACALRQSCFSLSSCLGACSISKVSFTPGLFNIAF